MVHPSCPGPRTVDRLAIGPPLLVSHGGLLPWPGPAPAAPAAGSLVISVTAPRAHTVITRSVGDIEMLIAPGWRRALFATLRVLTGADHPARTTPRAAGGAVMTATRPPPPAAPRHRRPAEPDHVGTHRTPPRQRVPDPAVPLELAAAIHVALHALRDLRTLPPAVRGGHLEATLRTSLTHHQEATDPPHSTDHDTTSAAAVAATRTACAFLATHSYEDAYLALRTAHDLLPTRP